MIKEKLNKGFGYFKKLIWLFLLVILILNIVLYYFVSGYYYLIALIIGNIILVWILIPIFIWIGKTYLINESIEAYEELKDELVSNTDKILNDNKKNYAK